MPGSVGIGRISDRWQVGSEWTPQRIATSLREAVHGNAAEYLTLAEDIGERDLHYASVLQTRKLAVIGEELEITSGDGSEAGQKIADDFREQVVETEAFHEMLLDLMDGLSKSYAVVQPIWDTTGARWNYKEFQWVDQRLFKYDPETMSQLRIDDQTQEGIEIPPGQFIIYTPKIRSGLQIRGGLARLGVISYMFKNASVKQWAAFAETYGMPLRLGTYDPHTATAAEIAKLRSAVINLAFDAAAIIPNDMDLQVLDARRPTSGDNVFRELADWWDSQVSKFVLGQTLTADAGKTGSLAQAQVHERVALKVTRWDARSMSSKIRTDVATPWVRYNYGPKAPVPKARFDVEPPEDLVAFSEAITPLVVAGLRVSAQEVRCKFGLSEPTKDEELVSSGLADRVQQTDPAGGSPSPAQARPRQTAARAHRRPRFRSAS